MIPRLARGGAGQALLALLAHAGGVEHRVLSLEPPDPAVALPPGVGMADRSELARADIVHVHFWNSPALYELLAGDLPPMRLLLWLHVGGDRQPHLLTPALRELADVTVACTPYTRGLPLISAVGGWQHLAGLRPEPHEGLNVGYVGTVDFVKMHPRFVELSTRVDVPEVRFTVAGGGAAFRTIERQATAAGASERFDLRGWVGDVRPLLARLDVFGYPLREDNFAGSELALQEAMYAGVPPVILPHGGAQACVDDGVTGLVARDADDYPRALERLLRDPEERRRLGHAAREHALAAWSPEPAGRLWEEAYAELMEEPKRERRREPSYATGAALLAESLGGPGAEPALDSPPVAAVILEYRNRFPDDPGVRVLMGRALEAQGRPALAAGEFAAAARLTAAARGPGSSIGP